MINIPTGRSNVFPRIPLEGSIDLTYRCNNNCRHCWLWMPDTAKSKNCELSLNEIKDIVDDARSMGCRQWFISGGEPMLREDFPEIFDYITGKAVTYTINTNGMLITPEIAQMLKRRGSKMIALYGATAEVHDRVTRNPGSFEATMRGFANMKEAGAGFIVQIIPLRDNYHQFEDMLKLASSISPNYRVGAAWLYLSADRSAVRNREIMRQRLEPKAVVDLDKPYIDTPEPKPVDDGQACGRGMADDRLFDHCIAGKRGFHIDPYGRMSFCCYIKDPALRYDLRKGSFAEAWDTFIPSIGNSVRADSEYLAGCGSCDKSGDCRWCPVYGYLEHGRFTAKVEYLCDLADETRKYRLDWCRNHRRYFGIGGMTICVDSDLPILENTFSDKLVKFMVKGPGADNIQIGLHFSLPTPMDADLGKEVYRRPPWAIYRKGDSWIFLGISPIEGDPSLQKVAVFNKDYTKGEIYNSTAEFYHSGNLTSLTMFATDQILLAPLLADRQGIIVHSGGMIINGHGLLFAGHSEAGKSTTVTMLKDEGKILCDDRIIIRRQPEGFRMYGTWSHGTVTEVSPDSAPLRAIMFIEKSEENRLIPITRGEAVRLLSKYAIKSVGTAEWWNSALSVIEQITKEVPVYILKLDKSGKVKDVMKELTVPAAK